jgi:hypothetical protein
MEEKIPLNFKPHTIEAQGAPMETLKQLVRDKENLIKKRDRLIMSLHRHKAIISALRNFIISQGLNSPRINVSTVKVGSRIRRAAHMRFIAIAVPNTTNDHQKHEDQLDA